MADSDTGSTHHLPGCAECWGIVRHLHTCSAYDPANVITSPGGWHTPSGYVPVAQVVRIFGVPERLLAIGGQDPDWADTLRDILDTYTDDEGTARCCGCGGVTAHGVHNSRCYPEEG